MNDIAGIRPNKSYHSIVVEAGGPKNMSFLEKDCRNFLDKVRRLRLGEGDANAINNYFLKMQADNSKFFYVMDLDEKGRLNNIFWADARSRAAYEEFGDVITFDTTYLTNKYDMPFAPFIGGNHHGQSILLGCGLISKDDTDTFKWLFKSRLTCMSDHAPSAIITDQDKAMQNTIKEAFPRPRHRLCLWHIMKKLPGKLKAHKEYDSIKFFLNNAIYNSLIHDEFEESWAEMIKKYKLENNDWLSGLYDERYRRVPIYVKDYFWVGMSTTQRSESMNSFFDGYVNSKTMLKKFVEQYENAPANKVSKKNQEDFSSNNSMYPCITDYEMEKELQSFYTNRKLKEFQ
ncbi:protein FAR-RED IMPAIRED RESPONSE 1-like [Apium graveolens]|uniref:protein FAR-RED IMPAIRED RESPONSE 1-like n=1 Tax=Apium graveolens TaxID=4045 RepID=UPI003D7B2D95